jgi:hypothetical protein
MPKITDPTLFLAVAAFGVLTVACARPGASEAGNLPASVKAKESAEPMPSAEAPSADGAIPSLPSGDVPAEMLEQVVADAASGAGVDPSAVRVVSAEAVTWSDGSLGCPEPGMMYTQALVPGYRVVVEIDGEELHFHASQSGDFAFCEDPQPPADDGTIDR